MVRQMPKQGYYLTEYGRVYYCTGTLKGNKWYCPRYHPTAGWMTLLWTCVPTISEMETCQFSEGPPSGVPPIPEK